MDEIEKRFETLLARWIPDRGVRDRWRAHLHRGDDAPASSACSGALVFKGRTGDGTRVAIYETAAGAQEVHVDGHPATRPYEHVALVDRVRPVRILGREFEESFDAPDEATLALRRFFAGPRGEPPWEWARPLLDDGLIDRNFSLTARGRRLLAQGR